MDTPASALPDDAPTPGTLWSAVIDEWGGPKALAKDFVALLRDEEHSRVQKLQVAQLIVQLATTAAKETQAKGDANYEDMSTEDIELMLKDLLKREKPKVDAPNG